MSHYISSFLIEPVVRQARRFSRPSTDAEAPHATTRRLLRDEIPHAAIIDHHTALAVTVGLHEIQHEVDSEHDGETSDFEESTSGAGSGTLAAALQAWTQRRDLASPLRRADSEPEVYTTPRPPRRHMREAEVSSSRNLLREESDSLMSMNSSTSGSVSTVIGVDARSPIDSVVPSMTSGEDISGGYGIQIIDTSLPADDGMGPMRQKILAIQGANTSNQEKARCIHELMTLNYISSQSSQASQSHLSRSPRSLLSSGRPYTPVSTEPLANTRQSASPTSTIPESSNPFQLTTEALMPTYFSKLADVYGGAVGLARTDEQPSGSSESFDEPKVFGCPHYKRNIKLQCSLCERWYTCRFCHDEKEDHSLNRRETKNMLCMFCGFAQPAAEVCVQCGERAAWYYCSVCKLWDDDSRKSIYHCDDCGICRVGQGLGKDFYHCKTCCVCLSISIQDTHRCIERSTDCDCPICGEYMFTSPQTVVFMRCGHSIHQRCYYEYMHSSYKCPICSRSIVNMEMTFRHLERSIESQPMPPQFQDTKAFVYCNDCNAKTTVKYHWLGLKCAVCDSYNTAQLQILSGPNLTRTQTQSLETRDISTLPNPIPPPPIIIDPPSRGRQPTFATGPRTRVTTSADAERTRPANPQRLLPRRTTVSESPDSRGHYFFSSNAAAANSDSDADSSDTDEDYSDVDFWGGESPTNRARSPPIYRTQRATVTHSYDDDDDFEDDGDDGDDEDDEDDDDDADDDDDDDENMSDDLDAGEEGDEGDRMEIFGHR